MDLNHMLLAIGCAASMPSAGLMLRDRLDKRLTLETAVGAAICITCLGLIFVHAPSDLTVALAAGALVLLAYARSQPVRWPLLMLSAAAFLTYLHRAPILVI